MPDALDLVGEHNFKSVVLDSKIPVLVDFFDYDCPPCIRMLPLLDEIAAELKDRIRIVKVRVSEAENLAAEFGINSIPAFLLFHHGEEVNRFSGAMPKGQLKSLLMNHLA